MWVTVMRNTQRAYSYSSDAEQGKEVHGIQPMNEFHSLLFEEQERSNRFGSKFSLLIFHTSTGSWKCSNLKRLIDTILKRIRYSDEMGWYKDDQIGVILPSTGKDGAEKLAEDITNNTRIRRSGMTPIVFSYPA